MPSAARSASATIVELLNAEHNNDRMPPHSFVTTNVPLREAAATLRDPGAGRLLATQPATRR